MIRRLAKKVLNRLLDGAPRVPNAPSKGRDKPVTGEEWRAQRGDPSPPSPEPEEEEELPEVEVQAHTIVEWIEQGTDPLFVDIRERHELYSGYVKGAKLIRMNDVPEQLDELPGDRPLIIYCAAGVRSYSVAHWLREQGFEQAWSLVGGISSWLATGAAYEQPEKI
jgi:rhodanese-related sulfurtransferase